MTSDEFDKWNTLKKEISTYKNKGVSNGKVYWLSIGKNIGCEVYGKGELFKRPVLVISKIHIPNYINAFLGIPLSSKTSSKSGKMFYKFKDKQGLSQVALLYQIRVFDTKRVVSNARISLFKDDFLNIKEKVINIISHH